MRLTQENCDQKTGEEFSIGATLDLFDESIRVEYGENVNKQN